MYVLIEQAVGVGIVFAEVFHIAFKFTVIVTIIIVAGYVAWAGMRGTIFNDLVHLLIINSLFIVLVIAVINKYDVDLIYGGLLREATTNGRADLLNLIG